MALLPENEVKICSRPKINFLHFTRRTPTNVFPHNNNQPGNCLFFFVTNYLTDICQIYLLWIISEIIILNACFNALWNHHELELSSRWQADHICQIYLLKIMSSCQINIMRDSRELFLEFKKRFKVFVEWNHHESDLSSTWQADWFSGCGVRHAW